MKIKCIEELNSIIINEKKSKKAIIGLCHGVFDVLHYGHIDYFKVAKSKCDILIVSVTSDAHVGKGPTRPIFNEEIRMKTLEAIEHVDYICLSDAVNSVEIISKIKPDLYFKGIEYKNQEDLSGNLELENRELEKNNGKIYFTNGFIYSSSKIINNNFNFLSDEPTIWTKDFSKRFNVEEFRNIVESIKSLKVLVIGEAIKDEYVNCEVLGKTSKSHIVAFKEISQLSHLGGTLSIANHIAQFVNKVDLFSTVDIRDFREGEMLPKLNSNIEEVSIIKTEIIRKKRYLNQSDKTKLFEVYSNDFIEYGSGDRETINKEIIKLLPKYDLVVVADYGHGLISDSLVKIICSNSKQLCLNVQSNAGNRGLNTISKYNKANYVCINGDELFLETKKQDTNVIEAASDLANRMNVKLLTITNLGYKSFTLYKLAYLVKKLIKKVLNKDIKLILNERLII